MNPLTRLLQQGRTDANKRFMFLPETRSWTEVDGHLVGPMTSSITGGSSSNMIAFAPGLIPDVGAELLPERENTSHRQMSDVQLDFAGFRRNGR